MSNFSIWWSLLPSRAMHVLYIRCHLQFICKIRSSWLSIWSTLHLVGPLVCWYKKHSSVLSINLTSLLSTWQVWIADHRVCWKLKYPTTPIWENVPGAGLRILPITEHEYRHYLQMTLALRYTLPKNIIFVTTLAPIWNFCHTYYWTPY